MLRRLFERLGATYIKLGQFIASSPTLFPPEYVAEFQKCLDRTDPVPWTAIEKLLDEEAAALGLRVSDIFVRVDKTPLATASVAQVHTAGGPRLRLLNYPTIDNIWPFYASCKMPWCCGEALTTAQVLCIMCCKSWLEDHHENMPLAHEATLERLKGVLSPPSDECSYLCPWLFWGVMTSLFHSGPVIHD